MASEAQLIKALQAADDAGNAEDAAHLAEQLKAMRVSTTSASMSGLNTGLANVAGLPVDLISGAANLFGADIQNPVGGSDWLKQQGERAGAIGGYGEHEFAGRVGEEVGAQLLPTGGFLAAANKAKAPANALLARYSAAPMAATASDVGTAVTAGLGAATAQQMLPDSQYAEILGSLTGGIVPTLASGVPRLLMRGTDPSGMQQSIDDFATSGTSPTVGQGTGAMRNSSAESVLGAAPGSSVIMRNNAENTQSSIGETVTRTAESIGATNAESAGRTIREGIIGEGGFVSKFRAQSNDLYKKVDETIDVSTPVEIKHVQKTLDEIEAPIPGAPNVTESLSNKEFSDIAAALRTDGASGSLSYEALDKMRKKVGQLIADPSLISTTPKGELKQLYKAINNDIESMLATTGNKGGLVALGRAKSHYGAGMKRIDETLQKLANKPTTEQIFLAATNGKNGPSVIRQVKRSLKKDEWEAVAGTVLKRMGKANPSKQDELGEIFSTETFLTNWNKLDKASRQELFGGTPKLDNYRRDIEKVARTASKIRDGSSVLSNPSGSGAMVANTSMATASILSLFTGNYTALGAMAGTVAASAAAAKLMTSPSFVKWLAKSSEIHPTKAAAHVARLANIDWSEDEAEAIGVFLKEKEAQGGQ